MRLLHVILSLSFISWSIIVYSQQTDAELVQNTVAGVPQMQSPTVSNLGVFGDIPVSLNTGIPNISIPITTIKDGDVSVPISIDYHASGIRVSDNSGLVGVKWTINAGGIVSIHNPQYNPSVTLVPIDAQNSDLQNIAEKQLFEGFIRYSEPVGFSYSFLGRSGKFFWNGDHLFLVPQVPGLKISGIEGGGSPITIIDEKGHSYYFGTDEETESVATSGTDETTSYISARFLDEITSPKGSKVSFEYEPNYVMVEGEHINSTKYYFNNTDSRCEKPSPVSVYRTTTFESQRIKRIYTSSQQEVVFVYNDHVPNNDGSGQLESIVLNSNGQMLKKWKIKYEYNGRYNIEQIDILDKENNKVSDYQFDYVAGTVPDRNTKGVDYFGYNNGLANLSWFPEDINSGYGDAIRSVRPSEGIIGMLKTIKYPTGGESEFVFSPHSVAHTQMPDEISLEEIKWEYMQLHSYMDADEYEKSDSFIIGEDSRVYCPGTTDIEVNVDIRGFVKKDEEPEFEIIISSFTNTYGFDGYNGMEKVEGGEFSDMDEYRFNGKICMPQGNYEIFIYKEKGDQIECDLSWRVLDTTEDVTGEEKEVIIGGFRISEIRNTTENGLISRKIYRYRDGIINRAPQYLTEETFMGEDEGVLQYVNYECNYKALYTSSIRALGTTNGSYVSYEYVEEHTPGNGYVEYRFYNSPDYISFSSKRSPLTSLSHIRGLLRGKKNVPEGGSTENPLKEIQNTYDLMNTSYLTGLKVQRSWNLSSKKTRLDGDIYSYELYEIQSCLPKLKSSITTEYLDTGQEIVTTEEFLYDNPYRLKTKSTVVNSLEEVITTQIKYPYETLNDNNGFSDILESNNILAVPVSIEQFKNSELISGAKYTYNTQGQKTEINELVIDEKVYRKLANYQYYNNGKLKSVVKSNGERYIYLWGYNNQYPVVKIESPDDAIAIDQIQSNIDALVLTNSDDKSDIDTSIKQLKDAVGSVDNKFNRASYYTYAPLVGMTSETDPNGVTIYYEYDDFGRLAAVKDNDDKLLSSYAYHYAEELAPPQLDVTQTSFSFGSATGTQSVGVTSNINWTVSDNASWISVSPASGSKNGNVAVSCSANSSNSSRNGTVTITGEGITKTVSISQAGAAPSSYLNVPSSIQIGRYLSFKNILIDSNVNWSASSSVLWLSVSPSSGSNNGSLRIICENNPNTRVRIGTITVSGGGITKTIRVTQDGNNGDGPIGEELPHEL